MMSPESKYDHIDFDKWKTLYESDPEEFERVRAAWLDKVISQCDEKHQNNLRALNSKANMVRESSANNMDALLKLNSMMSEQFHTKFRPGLNHFSSGSVDDLMAVAGKVACDDNSSSIVNLKSEGQRITDQNKHQSTRRNTDVV